jgi:hypothetical protein
MEDVCDAGPFFALCGRIGPPILGETAKFCEAIFFKEQLNSVNLLHTMISTVCILCIAAHAISDDRAAKMQRTALLR